VRLSPAALKKRIEELEVMGRIATRTAAGPGRAGRLFLVGGALRELALGQVPKDYDFALERPEDLALLEEVFGAPSFVLGKKPIQTHRIVAGHLGLSLDVTILEGDIEADLARRDFTVNAMAFDPEEGALFDPLGGLDDVARRVLRSPREGTLREDPLRMVKALRHLAALRGFRLDPGLKAAIGAQKGLIAGVAAERIKYELDLMLAAPGVHKGIEAMEETGLLFELFPELLSLQEMDREKGFRIEAFGHTVAGFRYVNRVRRWGPFDDAETRQAAYGLLFHDLGKPATYSYDQEKGRVHFFHHERHSRDMAGRIMERLRFGAAEMKAVLGIIESHMRIFLISGGGAAEKAVRRLVYKMEGLTPSLVFLTLLDLYGNSKGKEDRSTLEVKSRCREVLDAYEEWKREPLPRIVTGFDLLALGFEEGPGLGRVLREVRERQIAGEITEKEEALRFAASRLLGLASPPP